MKNIYFCLFVFITLVFLLGKNATGQNGEIDSLLIVLDEKEKSRDTIEVAGLAIKLGDAHEIIGEVSKAQNYYYQALKLFTENNDKEGIAISLNNIANMFEALNQNQKALDYHFQSLKISEETGNKKRLAISYHNIGNNLMRLSNYKEALVYLKKALKLKEEQGNKNGAARTLLSIAENFKDSKVKDSALIYYNRSLILSKEVGDEYLISIIYQGLGDTYFTIKDYNNAHKYYTDGLKIADKLGSNEALISSYYGMYITLAAQKKYSDALRYHELYTSIKDSIYSETNIKSINEMQTKYDTEKKDKELIKKDAEINIHQAYSASQKTQRNAFIIGFVLMLGLAFFIFRSYKQKKRANLLLEKKNETISQQNSEIEKKNTVITDSIEYAQNIQQAILPDTDEIKKVFANHFIFYKPKDIVSGDFYWLHTAGSKVLFVVADCTGHGVPGAFMSFMGYNLLENIMNTSPGLNPSELLEELNNQILTVLKQKNQISSAKFGMDISLISMDRKSNQLEFAGAHNSMYIFRKEEFIELKADKRSIGSFKRENQKNFTNHLFQLHEGDVFYLFTDGYHDQIGGPENKKYFSRTFRELLQANSEYELSDQKEVLDKTISDWKGNKDQTDDMLVVGIKI